MDILIVTQRRADLVDFGLTLGRRSGGTVRFAGHWAEALAEVKQHPPAFMVIDAGLTDGEPLALARKLVLVDPRINAAVMSPLSGDAFHEASEGLGILASCPLEPTANDATRLAEVFRRFV